MSLACISMLRGLLDHFLNHCGLSSIPDLDRIAGATLSPSLAPFGSRNQLSYENFCHLEVNLPWFRMRVSSFGEGALQAHAVLRVAGCAREVGQEGGRACGGHQGPPAWARASALSPCVVDTSGLALGKAWA